MINGCCPAEARQKEMRWDMKRYIGSILVCICLLLPCVSTVAQEIEHMEREENFDLPEMAEEIESIDQ